MEKKRGRKKQSSILSQNDETTSVKVPKKRGRKPKGGKIIVEDNKNKVVEEIKPNIILHLKCKLDDIKKNDSITPEYDPNNIENIIHYNIQQQNKGMGLQYDIIEQQDTFIESNIQQNNTTDEIITHNTKDVSSKLKQLSKMLHNNISINENSACFWCTCEFKNQPIFIPKYKKEEVYHSYGHFCSPACAAGYLFQENIDTSVKYERYQLLNFIYNKAYNFEKNIVPAPSPHYLLDKFCGNLSIDEYRNLMEQDKVIFVMDKPLSRNYPELFEENNEFQIHTINTFSKKKRDVSKQNIFQTA